MFPRTLPHHFQLGKGFYFCRNPVSALSLLFLFVSSSLKPTMRYYADTNIYLASAMCGTNMKTQLSNLCHAIKCLCRGIPWHDKLKSNHYQLSQPWCHSGDDHYSEWMPQASWNPTGSASWQTLNDDHGPGPRPSPGVGPGPELDPDPQWVKDPIHLEQFTKEREGTACLRWNMAIQGNMK